MRTDKLTGNQKDLVCFAINFFGTTDHPRADNDTLGGFTAGYVRDCINKMRQDNRINFKTKMKLIRMVNENKIVD